MKKSGFTAFRKVRWEKNVFDFSIGIQPVFAHHLSILWIQKRGSNRVVGHSPTGPLPSGPQVWKLLKLTWNVTKEFTGSNPFSCGINGNSAIGNAEVSRVFELHPDSDSQNNTERHAAKRLSARKDVL